MEALLAVEWIEEMAWYCSFSANRTLHRNPYILLFWKRHEWNFIGQRSHFDVRCPLVLVGCMMRCETNMQLVRIGALSIFDNVLQSPPFLNEVLSNRFHWIIIKNQSLTEMVPHELDDETTKSKWNENFRHSIWISCIAVTIIGLEVVWSSCSVRQTQPHIARIEVNAW